MTFRLFLATAAIASMGACLTATAAEVSWLFLQHAESASFDGKQLRLEGVDPETTAFSDRPYRAVQVIPTAGFVAIWGTGPDSLAADPPNAGLSGLEGEAFRNAVVELSDPRMDGEALVYAAVVLHGTLPATLTQVSVLVDALPTPVNDQITDAVTQTNTKVLGDAPALAMGSLMQSTADTLAQAASNAVMVEEQALPMPEPISDIADAVLQPDPAGAPIVLDPGP
jgi:hypothetical protein